MAAKKAARPAKKAAVKKSAAKGKAPPKKAVPKKPGKASAKSANPTFGRAGTAGKADGAAAVQAWLDAVKPEHQEMVRRLDALIGEEMPDARRAIKWSMPMYGLPGQGWICHLASFKDYVTLGFFAGTQLTPAIPAGESGSMRRANFHSMEDLDEKAVRGWLRQAARLPGWGKVA